MTASFRNRRHNDTTRVLLATEDVAYGATLERFLQHEGYSLERVHDAPGVLRQVSRQAFDVIALDLALSESGDVDLISFIRRRSPATQLVLLFEMTRIERALDGIRQGAFFYLPNTSAPSDVALVIGKAVRDRTTQAAVRRYERDVFDELAGGSAAMKRVIEMVSKVAPTDSTVLLIGESGTGKEIMANMVHRLSGRREMPFVAINCAALPEQLLESEMFGHVKGAFTGAESDKQGLFHEADGGTIFLDEIGDMALVTQAKLLRVLQNGEIRPVGASVTERVDVRVIAATNRNLEQDVADKRFREDLYFRLNVVQIRIPPLRERMEALPKLVGVFMAQANARFGRSVTGLDEEAQTLLSEYRYPGNVRELESIVQHAVIMADDAIIRARDLPEQIRSGVPPRLALPSYAEDEDVPSVAEMEARLIRRALDRMEGNQTEAAKKLGISRSTLWRKMKEYGIGK